MSEGRAPNGLHYDDHGAGDPVIVFIHGSPFGVEQWRPQIDAIGDRFRTVAYDVRGHGRSPVGDGQYTIELFVDDLIGLLDHLSMRRVVLCGLSMGGYIALRAMERNPDRVSALVLCDTRSEADGNEAKLKRANALRLLKSAGRAAFIDATIPNLFTAPSILQGRPAVAAIRKMMEECQPLGIGGTILALASRTDTTEALARISVPTLLLVGAEDALTPPPVMEAMSRRIRGSELRVIANAGHVSCLENPEGFNGPLLDFLSRL